MRTGLIGKKIGSSSYFQEKGTIVPITLVKIDECIVCGIKTEEKDRDVTQKYVDLHIDMGIEAMTKIGDEGEKIKHFKY